MRHVVVLLVTLALALVGPLVPVALTAHGDWHDHYTDATGVKCCGIRDCIRTVGRMLDRDGERVQVEVKGIPLWMPAASVHNSEDGAFWVCIKHAMDGKKSLRSEDIRCVFVAIGS
mgnify:CR=1 FL=1